MSNENILLPDFYVAGFPKCGTTTLSDWLGQHPQINAPVPKEPNIFAFDDIKVNPFTLFENFPAWIENDFDEKPDIFLRRYNNVFSDESKLKFDASPGYCISKKAIRRIKKYTPEAKFIFVLRHPTRRALSHYWHAVRHKRISTTMEKHLRYHSKGLLIHSRYLEHLEIWFDNFDKSQFHFVILEELKINQKEELHKIANFLNITDWDINNEVKNKSIGYKSLQLQFFLNKMIELSGSNFNTISHYGDNIKTPFLKEIFTKSINQIIKLNRSSNSKIPTIPQEFIEKLDRYFERENKGLSNLIGKDLKEFWNLDI